MDSAVIESLKRFSLTEEEQERNKGRVLNSRVWNLDNQYLLLKDWDGHIERGCQARIEDLKNDKLSEWQYAEWIKPDDGLMHLRKANGQTERSKEKAPQESKNTDRGKSIEQVKKGKKKEAEDVNDQNPHELWQIEGNLHMKNMDHSPIFIPCPMSTEETAIAPEAMERNESNAIITPQILRKGKNTPEILPRMTMQLPRKWRPCEWEEESWRVEGGAN
ncbi:hypothetical protein DH2020_023846 [Rehmannia glutinosa]|uniref:Uncharacterized protein n=1 Tax=Rehmannia glutinosa TaxID=99300 RepID=A0ABR0W763_REHGL